MTILKTIGLAFIALMLLKVTEPHAQINDKTWTLKYVSSHIANISTEQLQDIIKKQDNTIFVDVRSPDEIAAQGGTMNVPRIHNIERGWLEQRVPERVVNLDTPIVVYCGVNRRSPYATHRLMQMGYSNVKNYADGFIRWRDLGLPVKGDNTPNSMLYRQPTEVVPGVWSSIGATAPPSYFNSGHNNNLSFIITKEGVVVVNAGDNALLASALHDEIKLRTNQPVKYVVLENGQGHAMLGSHYWQQQGAKIIAHEDTAKEIADHGEATLKRAKQSRRDKMSGTVLTTPDITFADKYIIKLGGEVIEVLNLGPAHSPGDVATWLPYKKVVISGDIAFHQRLLPVMESTDTDAWIASWENFEALGAQFIVPGHGEPTNYGEVTKYTRDYLQYLRDQMQVIIDDGGELQAAYKVDQSRYSHLDTYFELAQQNAGRVFREMEFEF